MAQTLPPVHPWLKPQTVALLPGFSHPLADAVLEGLEREFIRLGYPVEEPGPHTTVLLTSVPAEQPLNWREALLFTARRRFGLEHAPLVFTVVPMTPATFQDALTHLEEALRREPPDPRDFAFPGLAPTAYRVLVEQGRRGGAILALERVIQAQAKCLRVILAVGAGAPQEVYLFDLVGAHPRIPGQDADFLYRDLALRMVTVASTHEVTHHQMVGPPIAQAVWGRLTTPAAMRRGGWELGRRDFFTPIVHISDLVHVPAVETSISAQYSEGCFATWDPDLRALITTVTGSARPVNKADLGDDDLAVVVGVRSDGEGALVRHVEGKANTPPSSEAVEMAMVDEVLPRVPVAPGCEGPVIRSKLHGHRGVRSFDPRVVEFVPLDPPYYHYPVSCATQAQAWAIQAAFSRSQALSHPSDPRPIAFTVLPGHGAVLVEKWVAGQAPFQVLWEALDAGALEIEPQVPQGWVEYRPTQEGRMTVQH